jgi:hypothetical protein
MTTQLSLYNNALGKFLGERKLASLTEEREPRRILDDIWDDDFIKSCLESGEWNFATRTQGIDYSSSVEPPFGLTRAYAKPDDWCRTLTIATDPFFYTPYLDYKDEGAYWFGDLDILYVRFVSNDVNYGGDYSLWPPSFTHWVECHLAALACERITQSATKKETLDKKDAQLLRKATSIDAMNDPVSFPPTGSWVNARLGGWGRRNRER